MRRFIYIFLIIVVLVFLSYFFAKKSYNFDSKTELENSLFSVDPDCASIIKSLNSGDLIKFKKDLSSDLGFKNIPLKKSVCTFVSKNESRDKSLQYNIIGKINNVLVSDGWKMENSLLDSSMIGKTFAFVKGNMVIQISIDSYDPCKSGNNSESCEIEAGLQTAITKFSLWK